MRSPAQALLVVAIATWAGLFSILIVRRHTWFGTFDHDLGIWDQSVWLLARGSSFNTVRGLEVFGFHVSPGLWLFAPASWLGAGPHLLNVTMVVTLCAGSMALFLAGRRLQLGEWISLGLALAFLGNYAAQWMLMETFHPEVVAVAPLLFAWLAAQDGRWRAYGVWLALAVIWKEDVALAAAMLGVVLVVRGTRSPTGWPAPAGTRRAGWWSVALCGTWFLLAVGVIVPAASPEGSFTDSLFVGLGDTPSEVARTALTEPDRVVDRLGESDAPGYVRQLTGSFAFVALLSPLTLLVGAPQTLINLLTDLEFFWTTRVHYAALPLAACGMATVEGVARLRRLDPRAAQWATLVVVAAAMATALRWGAGPWSPTYRAGYWPRGPEEIQADLEAAVRHPGPADAVAATYSLVPHLSHREEIFTFPNPWLASNWGVDGERRPDPARVDWLVLRPDRLTEDELGVLAEVLARPEQVMDPDEDRAAVPVSDLAERTDPRFWEVLEAREDLFVAQRVRG